MEWDRYETKMLGTNTYGSEHQPVEMVNEIDPDLLHSLMQKKTVRLIGNIKVRYERKVAAPNYRKLWERLIRVTINPTG